MRKFLILLLLLGCTHSNPWHLDAINTSDAAFKSARLRYFDPNPDCPVVLELLKTREGTESFLSLKQFRFGQPSESSVKGVFIIEEERIEEEIPLREGRMRVKLSPKITEIMTLALQEGKKIRILVDGFEMFLDPQQFSRTYDRFLGKKIYLQGLIQGPIE